MVKPLEGFIIAMVGKFEDNRTMDGYKRWIEAAGGELSTSLVGKVTHLVVAKGAWASQPQIVKDALARKDIEIVTQTWIDDALTAKKKVSKKKVPADRDWRKIQKMSSKGTKGARASDASKPSARSNQAQHEKKRPRSKWARALDDETSRYASPALKRQKTSMTSKVSTASRPTTQSGSELGDTFTKSSTSAKRSLLSNDHHQYVDTTGFEYDLLLVKVLQALNQTQQLRLQIFESNASPHTYATVSIIKDIRHRHGKEVREIIVPTGASFATALRRFKQEFEARTGVRWEDRATACKRAKPKNQGGDGNAERMFIDPATLHAQGGARHHSSSRKLIITEEQWDRFDKEKFIWRNPAEGEPQGIMGPPSSEDTEAYVNVEDQTMDDQSMVDQTPDSQILDDQTTGGVEGDQTAFHLGAIADDAAGGTAHDDITSSAENKPYEPFSSDLFGSSESVAAAAVDTASLVTSVKPAKQGLSAPFVVDSSAPGNSPRPESAHLTPPEYPLVDLTLAGVTAMNDNDAGETSNHHTSFRANEHEIAETTGSIGAVGPLQKGEDGKERARIDESSLHGIEPLVDIVDSQLTADADDKDEEWVMTETGDGSDEVDEGQDCKEEPAVESN